jgi:hypothetical protein
MRQLDKLKYFSATTIKLKVYVTDDEKFKLNAENVYDKIY